MKTLRNLDLATTLFCILYGSVDIANHTLNMKSTPATSVDLISYKWRLSRLLDEINETIPLEQHAIKHRSTSPWVGGNQQASEA